MPKRYSAYNLVIESDLPLPELPELDDAATPPDVSIRLTNASPDCLEGARQFDPLLHMGPGNVWLHIPEVARFVVKDGRDIRIEPDPGVAHDNLRLFLLGSVFGALLFQRGYIVMHGNAIRIGDRCMMCIGHSGAGKSTLAAGFMQRGFEILADDVVPVDSDCRAIPGMRRIKLWQNSADHLNIGTDNLARIRADMVKYSVPVSGEGRTEPLTIRWIYILEPDDRSNVTVESLTGIQRFAPLVEHTYRLALVEGMALQTAHLARCGQLAGLAHIARIRRPRDSFLMDELIDLLVHDMAKNA